MIILSFVLSVLLASCPCEEPTSRDVQERPYFQKVLADYYNHYELLKKQEDWTSLVHLGEQAIDACQKLHLQKEEAKIRLDLASFAFYLGDYSKVYSHAQKGHQIATANHDLKATTKSLYLMSAANRSFADREKDAQKKQVLFQKARELAGQSLSYSLQTDDDYLHAKALYNLAAAHSYDLQNGDILLAQNSLQDAISIFRELSDAQSMNQSIIQLSRILLQMNDAVAAQSLLETVDVPSLTNRLTMQFNFLSARVEHMLGNDVFALQLATTAKDLAIQLNAQGDLQRIDAFIASLD